MDCSADCPLLAVTGRLVRAAQRLSLQEIEDHVLLDSIHIEPVVQQAQDLGAVVGGVIGDVQQELPATATVTPSTLGHLPICSRLVRCRWTFGGARAGSRPRPRAERVR